MLKATLRLGMTFLALFAMILTTQAQTAVWTEDFAGGVPAGWTSFDASGQGGEWTWCNDPVDHANPGCVVNWALYVNQHGAFASTTAANGFMVMDSDNLGNLPAPHVVQLTTAPLDFSALSEVWITSESLVGVFDYTMSGNVVLRVSTDGTNWTSFNLFEIPPGSPSPGVTRWTTNPGISITDISSVAAGESTVYLQWSWTGIYEYYWLLDDVVAYDSDPTPLFVAANDMQVNDNWYAVAPNLVWPLDMVEPFSFLADIENVGLDDQTNVTLTVTIEDEDGNVVFTEDLDYGTIAADSLAENVPFSGFFTPAETGVYTGYYSISADAADENTDNDTVFFEFLVGDTIFQKEIGGNPNRPADASWNAGDPWSWAYGNYFYVPDAGDNFFSHVFFSIDLSDASSLAGEDLAIKIYEWVDADTSGQAEPAERGEAIATMLYTMTGNETAANLISVPVTTLFGDPVPMEDETGYIVMVEYSASTEGTTIEMGFSNAVDYGAMILRTELAGAPRYGSLLGIAGDLTGEPYSTLGFGYDFVPAVRLSFGELSSVRERLQLPGKLSVFPNPSNNEVSLDMEFDQTMQNVSIQLFNINGQLLETRALQNVQQQTASFNVQNLPNGTYVLKVITEQGTRTERFAVQH